MKGRAQRFGGALVAIVAVGVVSVACSSDSSTVAGGTSTDTSVPCTTPDAATGTPVGVTEKDFTVELDTTSAKAGSTSFEVDNEGPSTHEFVVFATDLAPDALPVGADGNVDEEGDGVTHIDEIEDIGSGCQASLTVDLDAGNYVLICNLPGHYAAGMHAPLKVK
jgi:uncharacterized cupredoxin-like copper-binding protein